MLQSKDLYPSRQGREETQLPRWDPVVYSNTDAPTGPLSSQQLRDYERDGFLILPDFLNHHVEPILRDMPRLKQSLRGREELVLEPDSDELRTIFNPVGFSEAVASCFRDDKVLDIVEQLLGSAVYHMQSRINIKPPLKGRAFNWHSDFETWHVEDGMPRMRALTAWIMLTDNHQHNGPLYVIPGSHKDYISCSGLTEADNYKTSLRQQTLGVPGTEIMKSVLQDRDIRPITGRPGTLVIHECNLLHASPDNLSGDARSIAMCVYNSVENVPQAPFSGLEPRPEFLSAREVRPLRPASPKAA